MGAAVKTRKNDTNNSSERVDAYQQVTDQIIELLEAGTVPWHKPWNAESGLPRSMSTNKPYRGINLLLLEISATAAGYTSPWWGTYRQIQDRGGQVRKGEKSTLIVFWKQYDKKADEPDEEDRKAVVLRVYRVFNAEQTDGLDLPTINRQPQNNDLIEECDTAIAQYLTHGPKLDHNGDRAYYSPARDVIGMPDRSAFDNSEFYYGALFHELTHSTGHTSRLNRSDLLEFHKFGDANYSREELVAEMGAAFLSGYTGIAATTLPNSANYLASWVRVLKSDKTCLVKAAGQAQRAVDLILNVQHTS